MARKSEIPARRHKHAVRASHARSTGLLKGESRVLEGLPGFLRQGLLAEPRGYPAAVRLAQGPGKPLSDGVSTHRGRAIKVSGAEGPKLAGHEGAATQDFVLATGPPSGRRTPRPSCSPCGRWRRSRRRPRRSSRPCPPRPASPRTPSKPSAAQRREPRLLRPHAKAPLADRYYSQAAIQYGDHIAKVAASPASRELNALGDSPLGTFMRARLKTHTALCAFRHGRDGMPERELWSVNEVPN